MFGQCRACALVKEVTRCCWEQQMIFLVFWVVFSPTSCSVEGVRRPEVKLWGKVEKNN